MTEVSNLISKDKNWLVINLILNDDLLISLINQLQRHLFNLKIIKSIDLKMNFFGLDRSAIFHQQTESNFQLLFQDALEKLTKKGFYVLINIDEVHLTPLLKKFASCYQIMI